MVNFAQLLLKAMFLTVAVHLLTFGVQALHTESQTLLLRIANQYYRMQPGRFSAEPQDVLYYGQQPLTECESMVRHYVDRGNAVGGFNYYPNRQTCEIVSDAGFRRSGAGASSLVRNGENPAQYANAYRLLAPNTQNLN